MYIPQVITKTTTATGNPNNQNNAFYDHYDVLLIAINTSSHNNVSTNGDMLHSNCDKHQGELSSDSLSITILGSNTNTSHLPSNINFTFPCDPEGCDESVKCVWYNETADIWQTDGCITIINEDNSEITCSCSHLTTFATIHNIHAAECEHNAFMEQCIIMEWEYVNWIVGTVYDIYLFRIGNISIL